MSENEMEAGAAEATDLNEVMDTNCASTALEFVKDNAAAIGILVLATKGAVDLTKAAYTRIKGVIDGRKARPKKPSLLDKLRKSPEPEKKEGSPEEKAE